MTVNTTIPCDRTATAAELPDHAATAVRARAGQQPPRTTQPADAPDGLRDLADILGAALAIWATRDDSQPQPDVRQAANTAIRTIDAMIAELHQTRARLIGEIRQSDDATMARTETLLSSLRGERP